MFLVVYWVGGYQSGEWKRALPVDCLDYARRMAEGIERAGRPAIVLPLADWQAGRGPEGPPSWWDFAQLKRKA